jgi:hypothetical protein
MGTEDVEGLQRLAHHSPIATGSDFAWRRDGPAARVTPAEPHQRTEPAHVSTQALPHGRGRNRRNCDQPINQARKTTNAELSKTPAEMPSHCFPIGTLPIGCSPTRATCAISRLGRLVRR